MRNMRNVLLFGIVALAALAMVTCDDGASLAQNDEGGISLSVTGLNGRALTGPLAEAGSDYYEATFVRTAPTPAATFRAAWSYARQGKIELLPGTYNVVLFAGRSEDKTLLGVGKVSSILNGAGTADTQSTMGVGNALEITTSAGTAKVLFEVEPLVNNINRVLVKGTGTTAIASTFRRTIPVYTNPTPADDLETPAYVEDTLGNKIPVFMIERDATSTVTWTFGVGDISNTATDNTLPTYLPAIIVDALPTAFTSGVSGLESLDIPRMVKVDYAPPPPVNVALPSGTFTFTIDAPGVDGVAKMAIQVPVRAFSHALTDVDVNLKAIRWYIRGGLNNSLIDAGIPPVIQEPGILGGAVVLGFGDLTNIPTIILDRE